MSNCPKCGAPLTPGVTACPNCGEPVNMNSPEPVTAPMAADPMVALDPLNNTGVTSEPVSVPPVAENPVPTAPVPEAVTAAPATPLQPMGMVENPMPGVPEFPMDTTSLDAGMPVPTQENPIPPLSLEEEKAKKEKKANIIMFVIVLVVSLLALALMCFFMIRMFSGKNQVEDKKTLENVKEYHYEGFYLYVPDDLYAEVYDSDFYIGDPENSWSAIMTLGVGTYNTLASNKSQLVSYYANMGYECTNPVEKEISGTSFVMTEVMMGTKNVLVAYAKANGTHVFGIVLENEKGEYADDDLRPIGTMIASMSFEGPKYKLPAGFRLDEFKETFEVAE